MPDVDTFFQNGLEEKIPTDNVCLNNLNRILARAQAEGHNLRNENIFVDGYQSPKFGDNWMIDIVPTLTRARAGQGGYFMTRKWRMMETTEMESLQGFPRGPATTTMTETTPTTTAT